ncbi:hypothetical protein [Urbifossiella limnaea]|uniref:Uncharacterized protein n=1 Tax=Urbifossiella limnaea TaxID=2528023 RepID=A0A517XZK0_9BACT|nr:hypothetical protein [Urbifossiella limnaea]QDU22937.1 hypothetical protein ETAA1_49260 [Urbifossiella limnaea]
MPSRPITLAIVLFWLATVGWVGYRDVWPRLVAAGPPPIAIDLGDEASQLVPVRWNVYRGDQRVGRLTTRMTYLDTDDTFRLTHQYSNLIFDVDRVRVVFPEVTLSTRVTRSGALREQSMKGRMQVQLRSGAEVITVAEARAVVEGEARDGVFYSRCDIDSPLLKAKQELEPVPVPDGHALSPLQPVGRIANVRAGQRWVVHEVNPLRDALGSLLQGFVGQHGIGVPAEKRDAYVATVGDKPEPLAWGKDRAEVPCWVIDYRSDSARVRTWVRVDDGRVLRQEATRDGEMIALERDE